MLDSQKKQVHFDCTQKDNGRVHKAICGGDLTDKFYPHIDFVLWDGEDTLGIDLPEIPDGWTETADGTKITLSHSVIDAEIYMLDDNQLEFAAILKVKPPGSKKNWRFDLVGWESFDFRFQEDATQYPGATIVNINGEDHAQWVDPDIGDTCLRPLDMCGGYAVYHATKANSEYGTGKVINIPRPIFIDNLGVTAWGGIDITSGVMSITPPDGNWLNSAAYPVTIDPTFGFTGVGATESSYASDVNTEQDSADYHTASTGDTLTTGHCYCRTSGATLTLDMAVYDISGGNPNSRLDTATNSFSNTSAAWNTVTLTASMVNGTTYGCTFHNNNTNAFKYYYDTGGLPNTTSYGFTTASPATWTHSGNVARIYSIYATYSTSGGATLQNRRAGRGIMRGVGRGL